MQWDRNPGTHSGSAACARSRSPAGSGTHGAIFLKLPISVLIDFLFEVTLGDYFEIYKGAASKESEQDTRSLWDTHFVIFIPPHVHAKK